MLKTLENELYRNHLPRVKIYWTTGNWTSRIMKRIISTVCVKWFGEQLNLLFLSKHEQIYFKIFRVLIYGTWNFFHTWFGGQSDYISNSFALVVKWGWRNLFVFLIRLRLSTARAKFYGRLIILQSSLKIWEIHDYCQSQYFLLRFITFFLAYWAIHVTI